MNFIAETNKHARALENWTKGHGFSDLDALQDLARIWNEFKNIPERRAEIYPGAIGNAPDVDVSCGNCSTVRDMLQMCVNWRKLLENEVVVDIPNVPQATVETVDFQGVVRDAEKEYLKSIDEDNKNDFYESMKMHELRRLAKDHKVIYSNKTKAPELIKLIKEKVSEKG